MKRTLLFLLLTVAAHAANLWDGGAGDGLWGTPANWDDEALPTGNPIFPAGAPNKQVNLGGSRFHERVILQGGYRLHGGRIVVFGGGANAEIDSTGDNTLDATFGTEAWGNSVKLIQQTGGTLTVNGGTSGVQKGVELRAHGTIVVNAAIAPGASDGFYKTGTGVARFTATATLGGGNERQVTAGTLLMNGVANNAVAWSVDGGRLGGTGVLHSSVTAGSTRGSVIAPGDGGVGSLTVNGNVTLGESATLEIELGNATACDRLAVSGAVNVGARTGLWLRTAAGATPAGTYTILTNGGARSGRFVLLDAPPGTTLDESMPGEVRVTITPPVSTENIVFPAGAGVLDVTQPPYNAVPNDGLDDTAAIQAALNAFPNGRRIIYLPNGIFDVSDTLTWPAGTPGASDYKRTILEGQSRDGVILRLKNNCPGFQSPATRKAVIFTGPAPAQRFGNYVRTLTVHTGSGNAGASGIQFHANNWGGIRRVKIVSGDGQGVSGLDLHFTAEIGPLFVQDIEIEGFNHGIRTGDAINGIVLERVTVRGQLVAGIDNSGQVFSIRGLVSVNSVPAVINGTNPFGGVDTGGACSLLDAQLIGLPGAENTNAIISAAFLYARNVVTTGYQRVLIRPVLGGALTVDAASLDEYATQANSVQFISAAGSLRLPIEDPPELPWDAPGDWADVRDFGAVGNNTTDDTAAFQAAIDSGKPTVLIPVHGVFRINSDVIVRGNVRRIIGTEADVRGSGRFVIVDAPPPVVRIERGSFTHIAAQTARTVIISACACEVVVSTGAGKVFIDDIAGDRFEFLHPAGRVWARQLNVESGAHTNILNDGAVLWLLGLKTERGQTKIATRNGGFTELLGMHNYSTENPGTAPLFIIENAAASFAAVAESNFTGQPYQNIVRETRSTTTATLPTTALPFRTSANGRVMTLYSGFTGHQRWLFDAGLAANATQDTDGDALPPLLEYALGGDPARNDSPLAPQFGFGTSTMQVTFPRVRTDVLYEVETSTNLINWSGTGVNQGALTNPSTASISLVPGEPRRFLRLRVRLP